MIGLLRRLLSNRRDPLDDVYLPFQNGLALFEYQCRFGVTDIKRGRAIVALVLDARAEAGANVAVRCRDDGVQIVLVKVADRDGGWSTLSSTGSGGTAPLFPGDVVMWVPGKRLRSPLSPDSRTRWVGLVMARIAPELTKDGFTILDRY